MGQGIKIHKRAVRSVPTARRTIATILNRFLNEQDHQLKTQTSRRYRVVIGILQEYLDVYGHTLLGKKDSARFFRHVQAVGSNHREFCQLFGADRILENVHGFLGDYIIRKYAGERLKRAAGTVIKKLACWLEQKDLVDADSAREAAALATVASRVLPRADQAEYLLYSHTIDPDRNAEADDEAGRIEYSQFKVIRVEPARLWLSASPSAGECGPLDIPPEVSELMEEGWRLWCSLGLSRERWWILDCGHIFPL